VLEDMGAGQTGQFIVAFAVVGLGLLALFLAMWFIRGRSNSTFIRGGKNREPRLAVLDAAPVDTRRRLVLVRRDSVEHLILIGGPTDVVIESRIASENPAASMRARSEVREPASAPVMDTKQPEATSAPQPQREITAPHAPVPAEKSAPVATRPAIAAGATTGQQAQPADRTAPPAPHRTPAPAPAPAPAQPVAMTASSADRHETDEALDALDAARDRVLSPPENRPSAPSEGPQAAYHEFDSASPETQSNQSDRLSPPERARGVAAFPASLRQSPRQEQPPRADTISDFESILEAELSGDIGMDDDPVLERDIAVVGADNRVEGDLSGVSARGPAGRERATKDHGNVDTLEDEMDKLLGDLTRRG
jgi:hypothetical protein